MSHSSYRNKCEVCDSVFFSKRPDAKTCSGKCRIAKKRGIESGEGRFWSAVRPEYQAMSQYIAKVAPKETTDALAHILYEHGAVCAEWAIAAVYGAVKPFTVIEREA